MRGDLVGAGALCARSGAISCSQLKGKGMNRVHGRRCEGLMDQAMAGNATQPIESAGCQADTKM